LFQTEQDFLYHKTNPLLICNDIADTTGYWQAHERIKNHEHAVLTFCLQASHAAACLLLHDDSSTAFILSLLLMLTWSRKTEKTNFLKCLVWPFLESNSVPVLSAKIE